MREEPLRNDQMRIVLRARHRDVKETTLFLDFCNSARREIREICTKLSPRPRSRQEVLTVRRRSNRRRRLNEVLYPRSRKLWRNASKFAAFDAIDVVSSTPMRQTLPGCCARAASSHATAAPPSRAINSRRLTSGTLGTRCARLPQPQAAPEATCRSLG